MVGIDAYKADLIAFHQLFDRPIKTLSRGLRGESASQYDSVVEGDFYTSNNHWLAENGIEWYVNSSVWVSTFDLNRWIDSNVHSNVLERSVARPVMLDSTTTMHSLMQDGYRGNCDSNRSSAICLYTERDPATGDDRWLVRTTANVPAGAFLGVLPGLISYDPFPHPNDEDTALFEIPGSA